MVYGPFLFLFSEYVDILKEEKQSEKKEEYLWTTNLKQIMENI